MALSSYLPILLAIGFAQLAAVISPGPSFLLTARTAVTRNRLEGFKIAAGLATGSLIWACAALFGLNVLFRTVPILFLVMKIAGALFLLYIAWMIFAHAKEPLNLDASAQAEKGSSFWRGLWVQLSNPKVVVFFGSIFVAMLPANPPLWVLLTLLVMVTVNELGWYTIVALFFGGGPVRDFYLKAKTWIDRLTGLFLGAIGLRLLWNAYEDR